MRTSITFAEFSPVQFVDFKDAHFRVAPKEDERLLQESTLIDSLVHRPTIFQRNNVRWIAESAWRSRAKERGVAALRCVKQNCDPLFIREMAQPLAHLISQLFGTAPADAVTCIPCGHSRRPDCFGKRFAQSVADTLGMQFVQVFADRPCAGTSHPKTSRTLPRLEQISAPPRSLLVVDDLATSGWHLEEVVLALRHLGATASALAWISGSAAGGTLLTRNARQPRPRRLDRFMPAPDPNSLSRG